MTADRTEARANRAVMLAGVLIGVALSCLVTLSVPFFDLNATLPGDPPVAVPIYVWPFAPVKLAVGLLLGPIAGIVAGVVSQVFDQAVSGIDVATSWNWVLAGGFAGFLAGWLPRRLPGAWAPSGRRRLAGAAVIGVLATVIGFLPVFLDPFVRPGTTWAVALGEYVLVVVPMAILAALMLPLVLAAGLRSAIHPAIALRNPPAAARPGWRPFALVLALAVALPGAQLYLAPYVRVVGPAGAAAGPAAAPDPNAVGAGPRVASVAVGTPPAVDRSCDAEGSVRSPTLWTSVDMTVTNETGVPIGILWLDFDGKRDETVAIDAGEPVVFHAAPGHLFMVTGPDGGCLVIFKVRGTSPIEIHIRA